MNPFTYLKLKRQARKRKQAAILLLMKAGTIRHASESIRYAMTEKEYNKMMREEA